MSLSMDRSTALRLHKDISDLTAKAAAEGKKAADANKRMLSAQTSAVKASSISMAKSYASTADRESRAMLAAQDKQVQYSKQIVTKTQELGRLNERIAKEEERERKADIALQQKRAKDDAQRRKAADAISEANSALQRRVADLEAQLAAQLEATAANVPSFSLEPANGETEVYDVFISHAWEDKEEFVDEFAHKAREAGLRVWYDRFALRWGDSLRQSIDKGLRSSYFGVVVLSSNFFAKEWTNYELDGLLERALDGSGRLLPIWHRLTKDDVRRHAPSLAGRLAMNTSVMATDDIVSELVKLRDSYRLNADGDDQQPPAVAQ